MAAKLPAGHARGPRARPHPWRRSPPAPRRLDRWRRSPGPSRPCRRGDHQFDEEHRSRIAGEAAGHGVLPHIHHGVSIISSVAAPTHGDGGRHSLPCARPWGTGQHGPDWSREGAGCAELRRHVPRVPSLPRTGARVRDGDRATCRPATPPGRRATRLSAPERIGGDPILEAVGATGVHGDVPPMDEAVTLEGSGA